MKIIYDKDADAMMIWLGEQQQIDHEQVIDDRTILQKDADENVISIELLNVSKYVADLSKVDFFAVARQYAKVVNETP